MVVGNNSIFTLRGTRPGKEVAIFAGVHGNEIAGISAVTNLINTINISYGTVHFVFANPLAIKKNKRYIRRNLNRCFYEDNDGRTYEDYRARQLMTLLGSCDALLDIHGYNSKEDFPFIITESTGISLARKMGVGAIVTNYSPHCVGGTDAYMARMNKIGICIECGSNYYPEKYVSLAEEGVRVFLSHFGLINFFEYEHSSCVKVFRVKSVIKKLTDNFNFVEKYSSFNQLKEGEIFATDGNKKYIAGKDEYILFPRANQLIGEEVFTIIELLSGCTTKLTNRNC